MLEVLRINMIVGKMRIISCFILRVVCVSLVFVCLN